MSPRQDSVKIIIALAAVAGLLGWQLFEAAKEEKRAAEAGLWRLRWQAAQRDEVEIARQVMGERWDWIDALRRHTPENALIAFQPPADVGVDLPQHMLALRLLGYPRRVELAGDVIRWIQEDWSRLETTPLFGLSANPQAPPPYPELWDEIHGSDAFRILRWKGKP